MGVKIGDIKTTKKGVSIAYEDKDGKAVTVEMTPYDLTKGRIVYRGR